MGTPQSPAGLPPRRSSRPFILIPCGTAAREDGVKVFGSNQEYVSAVQAAGGIPLMVAPGDVAAGLELLEMSRGLLLTGGADVDPSFYGAEPSPKLGRTEAERDELEMRLVHTALERGQPVFGICRGLQVINVALGGTLYQDLPAEHPSEVEHNTRPRVGNPRLAHTIAVDGGSRLAGIVGGRELQVNSFHHQAVKDLAPGVRRTAVSPDGLVEGLETADGRLLAVQCHPEELTRLSWARALFEAFIQQSQQP